MVELLIGLAVWYAHTQTSIDARIDPWSVRFLALQDAGVWDRAPQWYLVTSGDVTVLAQRRDVTRSRYVAEFSPALCDALGLEYGFNSKGVAYGTWPVKIRRWYPGFGGGRVLLY